MSSDSGSTSRLIAGAMSGTSADGVDVALTRIEGSGHDMEPQLVLHHHRPYPRGLREKIFGIRSAGSASLADLAGLARDISLVYAEAVNEALCKANVSASEVAAVAAHGQTLFHEPPNTIQWLDPALVAAEVGTAVISDFRRADCAAGGQGAPLVPFADYILFRHPTKNRVLLNIGGIANLTYLAAGAGIDDLIAFDTGPGNCISDHLCRTHDPGGPGYDDGGRIAGGGNIISFLVHDVLDAPYFRQGPPKSTDGPSMIRLFEHGLNVMHEQGVRPPLADLLATACHISAEAITRAILRLLPGLPEEVVVSGGGVENAFLMEGIATAPLGAVARILKTDELGVPGKAKEAIAFALLGAATLDEIPGNIPSVTGARRSVRLGSVTVPP
jgi:anhydro-N-acetylmuramic acid kinase